MAKKKYWAGFVDNKIYTENIYGYSGNVTLFTNKRIAKQYYEDVREVQIKEINK